MKIQVSGRQESYIFMITMADVALQIVFILFMLSTTMAPDTWSSIELKLPEARKSEQKQFAKPKDVTVSKKGQLYFNGVPVKAEELEAKLGELLKDAKGDERAVTIKADKTVDYQSVVTAIDIVNRLDGMLVLIVDEEGAGSAPTGTISATP